MTVSEELASFVAETTYNSLHPVVVAEVKLRVLDTLGALVTGSTTPVGAMLTALGTASGGELGHAAAIPQGHKLSLQSAVLVNSATAHCAEIDDIHPYGVVCTGAMVVPAALAMAEATGCTGKDLITAVAVGYEVATRCALAVPGEKLLAKGWWPSATIGPLGAAAATAKIGGYNRQVITNALGIAGILAGGLLTGGAEGPTGRHFLFGRAAQNGVEAAGLANRGFTGPSRIFEDERGLFASRGIEMAADKLLGGLGQDYVFSGTAIKAHACAFQLQAAVTALLKIMREHALRADDLQAIKVKLPPKALITVRSGIPANHNAATASAPFILAVAATDGIVSMEQFNQTKLEDKGMQSLMSGIKVEADHSLETSTGLWPAIVEVKLKEGTGYRQEVRQWVADELTAKREFVYTKFHQLTEPVWGSITAMRVIQAVESLEEGGVAGILNCM